jgi:hypothetical protein
MTLTLSPDQSTRWNEGGWLSYEVEETILEDLDRQHVRELVVVLLDDGRTAFAVTAGEVRP